MATKTNGKRLIHDLQVRLEKIANKKTVMAFIEKQRRYFSKESLENGIKKLGSSEKKRLRKYVYEK